MKVIYYDGLYVRLECGHTIWGTFDKEVKNHTLFKKDFNCPECKKVEE